MHIAIAPFRLKDGITHDDLLAASDDFEEQFVQKQTGILQRILVRDSDGAYADIVFFEDLAAIERVLLAEQNSDVCAAFFAVMDSDGSHQVYEALKTYR
jgi:hypothetical protein